MRGASENCQRVCMQIGSGFCKLCSFKGSKHTSCRVLSRLQQADTFDWIEHPIIGRRCQHPIAIYCSMLHTSFLVTDVDSLQESSHTSPHRSAFQSLTLDSGPGDIVLNLIHHHRQRLCYLMLPFCVRHASCLAPRCYSSSAQSVSVQSQPPSGCGHP